MRLPVFIFLALVATCLVGVLSALSGSSLWVSFGRAVAVFCILQIAYFVFLLVASGKKHQQDTNDPS